MVMVVYKFQGRSMPGSGKGQFGTASKSESPACGSG